MEASLLATEVASPVSGSARCKMCLAGAVVVGEDFGDLEEGAVGFGGVLQNFFQRQARADDVLTQDIAEMNRVSHRLDAGDVGLGDLGDVLQDWLELDSEFVELLVAEPEARELGDMAEVIARDSRFGHGESCIPRLAASQDDSVS